MLKYILRCCSLLAMVMVPSFSLCSEFLLGIGVHPQSFPGGQKLYIKKSKNYMLIQLELIIHGIK